MPTLPHLLHHLAVRPSDNRISAAGEHIRHRPVHPAVHADLPLQRRRQARRVRRGDTQPSAQPDGHLRALRRGPILGESQFVGKQILQRRLVVAYGQRRSQRLRPSRVAARQDR